MDETDLQKVQPLIIKMQLITTV